MPKFIEEGEYVCVAEAAKLVGVRVATIHRDIRNGKLPSIRVSFIHLIPFAAIPARKMEHEAYRNKLRASLEAVSDNG